jgi:hypothetical protein
MNESALHLWLNLQTAPHQCPECERLVAALDLKRRGAHAAGVVFDALRETNSATEYQRAYAARTDAWLEYDLAAAELARHRKFHKERPRPGNNVYPFQNPNTLNT